MANRTEAIEKMAALGAEVLAEAIIDALTPAGAADEWDSETIELVVQPIEKVAKQAGLPGVDGAVFFDDPYDTHPNTVFWQEIQG